MQPVFISIVAYVAAALLLLFWPTREFIRAVRAKRRISLSDFLVFRAVRSRRVSCQRYYYWGGHSFDADRSQ